jgi:hypothetical protein
MKERLPLKKNSTDEAEAFSMQLDTVKPMLRVMDGRCSQRATERCPPGSSYSKTSM